MLLTCHFGLKSVTFNFSFSFSVLGLIVATIRKTAVKVAVKANGGSAPRWLRQSSGITLSPSGKVSWPLGARPPPHPFTRAPEWDVSATAEAKYDPFGDVSARGRGSARQKSKWLFGEPLVTKSLVLRDP